MPTEQEDYERIILATGKVIEAFGCIIGIDDNGWVTEGHDSALRDGRDLSPADKAALADIMIARWEKYKAKCIMDADA